MGWDTVLRITNAFLSKVEITQSCWNWKAGTNSRGYGYFWFNNKQTQVHRFSYELFNGNIPDGLTIDHLCRNKLCVNPNHLEAVTIQENVLRGVGPTAQNARKTHCKNGHEFTKDNTELIRDGRRCKICTRRTWRQYKQRKKLKEQGKI